MKNQNRSTTGKLGNPTPTPADDETSSKYWNMRGLGYKIAMMTTTQSNQIENIKEFEDRINATSEKYKSVEAMDIPLPVEQWAAFAISPLEVEFWRYGSKNCHSRHLYSRSSVTNTSWSCVMLEG